MKEPGYKDRSSPRHFREALPPCPSMAGVKPGDPPFQPTLEVVGGQSPRRRHSLGRDTFRIGRSPANDLVINDEKVSRSHAEIYFEEGYYVIEDLDSTNGLQVNDLPIHKMLLKTGDRITLGDSQLVFTQVDPEPQGPPGARTESGPANNPFLKSDGLPGVGAVPAGRSLRKERY